jgi:hypothetical protein
VPEANLLTLKLRLTTPGQDQRLKKKKKKRLIIEFNGVRAIS